MKKSLSVLYLLLGVASVCYAIPLDGLVVHLMPESAQVYDANDLVYQWQDVSGSGNGAVMVKVASAPRFVDDGGLGYVDFGSNPAFEEFDAAKVLLINSNDADFVKNTFTWFAVYNIADYSGSWRAILSSAYQLDYSYYNYVWGSRYEGSRMMSFGRGRIGDWSGESSLVGQGMYGWNLVAGIIDPNSTSHESLAMDGDIDQYINPGTPENILLEMSKCAAPAGVDDEIDGNDAIENNPDLVDLPKHFGTVLGGVMEMGIYPARYSGNVASGSRFGGALAEVIIYNRALSSSEITEVADYLASRYSYGTQKYAFAPLTDCDGLNALSATDPGDFDMDCDVDVYDIIALAAGWLQ